MVIWRRDAFVTYLPIISLSNGKRLSQEPPCRPFGFQSNELQSNIQNSALLSCPFLHRWPVWICVRNAFHFNNSRCCSEQVCAGVSIWRKTTSNTIESRTVFKGANLLGRIAFANRFVFHRIIERVDQTMIRIKRWIHGAPDSPSLRGAHSPLYTL